MKTFLTFFVLFFSSSVVAEFPTKLFGVELYDDIKNYTKNQKSYYDTSDGNFRNWYYPEVLENMETNSYFESYQVYQDENDKIVSIKGFSDKYPNEHILVCFNEADQFADFLKSYYSLKKEFETNLYKESFFFEEDLFGNSIVYERRVSGKINGKKSILSISCISSVEHNYYPPIRISLGLINHSFEKKFKEPSTESFSRTYEYFNYSEFIRSFKELGFDYFNGF